MEKEIIISTLSAQKQRSNTMPEPFSGILGTVFYSVILFVAGALIGTPLWNWVKKFFPWNKD